ncbi:cytochrome c3 family protein [Desulfosarcina sp. OttesenSCG-928-G10]|nr:cytochrome c3 family protein [Desulfosarcina sp. OttesenSCG-928-G10]MDL2321183.1 cytochrome c3 family protein [Desulfosarcina sp. OttesenSCG-928-B08]
MRGLSYVGVVLVGMVVCTSLCGVATAENGEMRVPLGVIELKAPASVDAKRSAVMFDHGRHLKIACNTCHHTWDGRTPITGCMTGGCHDLDALPRKADSSAVDKAQEIRYYKTAYHGQCIECHKTMQVQIEQMAKTITPIEGTVPVTGPTGCIDCHPK